MDSLTALTPGATFLPSNNSYQNSARVKQVAINGTPPGEIGFSFDGIDNKGHGETNWAGSRSMGDQRQIEFPQRRLEIPTQGLKKKSCSRPLRRPFPRSSFL